MIHILRFIPKCCCNINMIMNHVKYISSNKIQFHIETKAQSEDNVSQKHVKLNTNEITQNDNELGKYFSSTRVVPVILTNNEPVLLPFDEVPGPKTLKYLYNARQYLSEIGTQITAGFLTVGLNIGSFLNNRKSLKYLSVLFDRYGPVVRFISPVGGDIVLINHPEYIEKVYNMEGDLPIRSTLDCLEKYRIEHRSRNFGGIYTVYGEEWSRQRDILSTPLHNAVDTHIYGINEVCENFVQKVYGIRNHQDEISKDLYKELHKWAFDCIGLVVFSKKFTMLDTETVYSQCDMSWLYHSLEKATEAIIKCESGLHLWKILTTPAWHTLVKYCDSLDNLIGKHVIEAENAMSHKKPGDNSSVINCMLKGDDRMTAEDIATVIMDMLLIGVNTIASSMSFMLYHLSKYQLAQKKLYDEVKYMQVDMNNVNSIKKNTPYLQACIKENLRLAPPIPVLSRILPRNITLDRYNIPQGTLIIMSTQDASLKESNYEDAANFKPERWLQGDASDYHAFASVPFGYGSRKCLGQNVAESMMTLLLIRLVQKYKLQYHYGDIHLTKTFIAKPNRPLKIRFIDRI
ncbi:hypothetical protein ACJJTC_006290 [Scirpophaga incertulas]